jgi:hypothetical protein
LKIFRIKEALVCRHLKRIIIYLFFKKKKNPLHPVSGFLENFKKPTQWVS